MKEICKMIGLIVALLVIIAACAAFPICYIYGRGKETFLRETKVIDLRNQPNISH